MVSKKKKSVKINSKNSFNKNLIIGIVVVLVLAVVAFSFGDGEEGEGLGSYLDFTAYYDVMMGAVGFGDEGGDEFAGMMGAPCTVDGDCGTGETCDGGFCMPIGGTSNTCADLLYDSECCQDIDGVADTSIDEGADCDSGAGTCSAGTCSPTYQVCSTLYDSVCTGDTPLCNVGVPLCVRCYTLSDADTKCATKDSSKPVCAPSTADPGLKGSCVECTSGNDAQCTGSTDVCDDSTNTCVQCTSSDNSACTGTTPICDSSNTCVACTSSSECLANDPMNPICDTSTGECSRCNSHSDCDFDDDLPICDTSTGECKACRQGSPSVTVTSTECAAKDSTKPVCVTRAGLYGGYCWEGCSTDDDCRNSFSTTNDNFCDTTTGLCKDCLEFSDTAEKCDGERSGSLCYTDGSCGPCTANSQCTGQSHYGSGYKCDGFAGSKYCVPI